MNDELTKKKQNVMILATWVYREALLWYFFVFGSSEILLFPQNAIPSSPVELSLTFSRRLFTTFSLFPLPLYLILSSLSFRHDIHCLVDFLFFSRQSKLSFFLGKKEAPPGALSPPSSWGLDIPHYHMWQYPHNQGMAESNVKLLLCKIISLTSVFSKRL